MSDSQFEIRRRKLQNELESVLGNKNVYFQPPESIKLQYPAIVYEVSAPDIKRADNRIYSYTNKFNLKYIRKNGNDDVPRKILETFSLCSENDTYIYDNLYHTIFGLYY